jgi:DNA-binding MarR family transcriptional regulator
MSKGQAKPLNQAEYTALAEFRYQIRRYLRFMEEKAREAGENPQQYQLILALKGLPKGKGPSISVLAERMQLNHNSTVELVDRCQKRGLVQRTRSGSDRRQVALAITPEGDAFLRTLASAGREALRSIGPILAGHIQHLISQDVRASKRGSSSPARAGRKTKTSS